MTSDTKQALSPLLVLAVLAFPQPASACSPVAHPFEYKHPQIESIADPAIEKAAYILEVRIEKVEEDWPRQTRRVSFTPIKSLKGTIPSKRIFESPMTVCDHTFETFNVGETQTVFLSASMRNDLLPRDGNISYYREQMIEYAKRKLSNK